jgi:hypothetical protein
MFPPNLIMYAVTAEAVKARVSSFSKLSLRKGKGHALFAFLQYAQSASSYYKSNVALSTKI